MEKSDVKEVYKRHWKPGWGAVSADEAMYIQDQIIRYRPQRFIEIGMASGLSGGLIARFMAENGGAKFVTLDHDSTFFGDHSKENGFLIGEIAGDIGVDIVKLPFTVSVDMPEVDGAPFDMAFVDASHQHPWPLLDTLCLYPYMRGERIVIHHDRLLYKNRDFTFCIGPKHLYDQFPGELRDCCADTTGNIFSVRLAFDQDTMEDLFSDAILIPWSMKSRMRSRYVRRFLEFMEKHYSGKVRWSFETAAARFNK